MSHGMQFSQELGDNVEFVCTGCGRTVVYNKEGIGEPCAALVDGTWTPSVAPDTWMGDCPTPPA